MLTLKQVNDISFRKSSFSGYKPEDVDDFIDEVSESFGTLMKENQAYKSRVGELTAKNADMREKLTILAQKIESYRNDEDGIKNVLLSAQKLGASSIREAKAKAEAITADANAKADEMVQEAKKRTTAVIESYDDKIAAKKNEFDAVKAAVAAFRTSLFEMYREHLNSIEAIPDRSSEINIAAKPNENNNQNQEGGNNPQVYDSSEFVADEDDFVEPTKATEIEDLPDDIFEDYEEESPAVISSPQSANSDTFGNIDFDAYSDIPEVLKKEKAALYSNLEFGEDVDFKKK